MENIIALIGKSNVGKSTLFNFLIKKKQSIVRKEYNTTINRNYGTLKIKNNIYNLIDTGGYIGNIKNNNNNIYNNIYNQILLSIKESNLILYIVDIINGVNYLDKELYLIIKKYHKKIFFLINKIDIKNKKKNIYDILNNNIDYKKVYYISTTHNIGINNLLNDINNFFKFNLNNINNNININISILGIPNSGKSTFINSFFLDNKSIVNNLAGTTIDTLYFKKEYNNYNFTLIDTPGIIKKYKYNKYKKLYLLNTKKVIKNSDICILIIDIYKGFNRNDLYIKDLIIKYKKGIIIIFNKCDLLKKNEIKYFEKIKNKYFNKYIPVKFCSLKYNFNKTKIKNFKKLIIKIYYNRNKKIKTSLLNKKLLSKINTKNFSIKNKKFKIKFCYQLKDKLFPIFVFISNLEKNINYNYIKFIEILIRKYIFNFYGVPIELIFKKKN
ncbi:MAG: ribosome biogenesis GTPase Der [Candidatus Shikimatogenerans sp. JK-2022]|nr:ribosome biogenesis GTPase Der [Candidatus Shikimatogenerans bostrichidophilus]